MTELAGVACGLLLLWLGLLLALWITGPTALTARTALRLLPDVIRLLRRLAGDRDLPRGVRVGIWLVLGYLALPIDLVPDFIPVVGWADDVVVAALGLRTVVRHGGPAALQRHWPGDPSGLRAVQRLAGMSVA